MRALRRGIFANVRVGGGTLLTGGDTPPPPPPPGGGGTGGGPIVSLGSALMPYVHLPGGQVVTLAAGTYRAGAPDFTKFSHLFDASKARNNWLIIVPEAEDACTINLIPSSLSDVSMLNLGYDAQSNWIPNSSLPYNGQYQHLPFRVMFVGFHFQGSIFTSWLTGIRFWHCTFTNPMIDTDGVDGFHDRYKAAYHSIHGSDPVLLTLYDATAGRMAGGGGATPGCFGANFLDNVEFYFCDFHDIGDDAVFLGGPSNNPLFYGCRWWNVATLGYDYLSVFVPGLTQMHPDGMQTIGGLANCRAWKCNVGAHFQHNNENGYGNSWDYRDWWVFDNYGFTTSHDSGLMKRVKWFAMGIISPDGYPPGAPAYYPSAEGFIVEYGPNSNHYILPNGSEVDVYTYNQLTHVAPPGYPLTGRIMTPTERTNCLNDPTSPAMLARAEQYAGLDEWEDWFARPGPVSETNPSPGWPA